MTSTDTPDLRNPEATSKVRRASAEFSGCLVEMEAMLRNAIKAFAEYHAADAHNTREQWAAWLDGPVPSQEYIDGFNAGVESVLASVETFLDDHNIGGF